MITTDKQALPIQSFFVRVHLATDLVRRVFLHSRFADQLDRRSLKFRRTVISSVLGRRTTIARKTSIILHVRVCYYIPVNLSWFHSGTQVYTAMFCVADFESHARAVLGKKVLDFYSSGANRQQTLRDNVEAFKRCIAMVIV